MDPRWSSATTGSCAPSCEPMCMFFQIGLYGPNNEELILLRLWCCREQAPTSHEKHHENREHTGKMEIEEPLDRNLFKWDSIKPREFKSGASNAIQSSEWRFRTLWWKCKKYGVVYVFQFGEMLTKSIWTNICTLLTQSEWGIYALSDLRRKAPSNSRCECLGLCTWTDVTQKSVARNGDHWSRDWWDILYSR